LRLKLLNSGLKCAPTLLGLVFDPTCSATKRILVIGNTAVDEHFVTMIIHDTGLLIIGGDQVQRGEKENGQSNWDFDAHVKSPNSKSSVFSV
jgi:hypothetical protein